MDSNKTRVIQIISVAATREEAELCLNQGQRIMLGFLGGRILEPGVKSPNFVVQTIHEDCDPCAPVNGWLPDGMRRCYLTANVAKACNIFMTTRESGGFTEAEDIRLGLEILSRDGSETDTYRDLARRALDRIRRLETSLRNRADLRVECSNYRRALAQTNILLSDFLKSETHDSRRLVNEVRDLIHGALE